MCVGRCGGIYFVFAIYRTPQKKQLNEIHINCAASFCNVIGKMQRKERITRDYCLINCIAYIEGEREKR